MTTYVTVLTVLHGLMLALQLAALRGGGLTKEGAVMARWWAIICGGVFAWGLWLLFRGAS